MLGPETEDKRAPWVECHTVGTTTGKPQPVLCSYHFYKVTHAILNPGTRWPTGNDTSIACEHTVHSGHWH